MSSSTCPTSLGWPVAVFIRFPMVCFGVLDEIYIFETVNVGLVEGFHSEDGLCEGVF